MKRTLLTTLLLLASLLPAVSVAAQKTPPATPFRYAAWIPYWRKADGIATASANLSKLHEISPFSYTLKADGTIVDTMKLDGELWPALLAQATSTGVQLLPSIASGEGSVIYNLLANTKKRTAHVAAIVKLVQDKGFDGIDIDYEAKTAETRPYYSAFTKELGVALHAKKKILSCTIEPRTPLSSLYYVPPTARVERVNDYAVLNKYCDQIRIMTYDQTTIDVKLNDLRGGKDLYAPIADVSWVHKVLNHALASFPAKKIMLGIPTYGYEFEVDPIGGRLRDYKIVRSWSYTDAYALAARVGATPARNKAGELSFSYATSTSILKKNQGLATTTTGKTYMRYVSFTDAQSIENLIILAKAYNLRGVAIFKIDGAADPAMWSKLTP